MLVNLAKMWGSLVGNSKKENSDNDTCRVLQDNRGKKKDQRGASLKTGDMRKYVNIVLNYKCVRETTLSCIKSFKSQGADTNKLNTAIVSAILKELTDVNDIAYQKGVRNYLHVVRDEMRSDREIYFDNKRKVWRACSGKKHSKKIRPLTEKERKFLLAKGLDPEHCFPMSDPLEAVDWIYENFTPDDYECFGCALLQHLDGTDMYVSKKRAFSGADGGVDGGGVYMLDDGDCVPIIFQSKKYKPTAQIGEDVCRNLAGTMMLNNVTHGVIITTATISKRSYAAAEKFIEDKGLHIDFIDKNKMIEIMSWRDDEIPHGLGIFKSDYGMLYLNKKALKQSVGKS